MAAMLNTEQILALAPDAASAKTARDLATSRKWLNLACNEQAAWGECPGSGKEPYRTQIDLSEPAFRCTCPSRKFPCKHGLGLFLLLANQPSEFAQDSPPPWVAEWLANRAKRAEQTAEGKKAVSATLPDGTTKQQTSATAQRRQAAQREKRVMEGLDELTLWFRDLMRQGLASVQAQPARTWETRAARLVDAQAPGVARLLREMSGIQHTGDGWPERLIERIGRAYLLIEGFGRLDSLPLETQADIRSAIGWTQSQEELLQSQPGTRDRWLVLGQHVTEEDRLRVQRTWLWGMSGGGGPTGQAALILQFAHGRQPFEIGPVPGTCLDADLVFYPGSYPQRALIKQRYGAPTPIDSTGMEGLRGSGILSALESYAVALTLNPWIERFPMLLTNVVPRRQDIGWFIRDEVGHILPVKPEFDKNWELLALSGGHPVTLFGEWNGQRFMPLSVFAYRFVHF